MIVSRLDYELSTLGRDGSPAPLVLALSKRRLEKEGRKLVQPVAPGSLACCAICRQECLEAEAESTRLGILRQKFEKDLTLNALETFAGIGGLGLGLEMGW